MSFKNWSKEKCAALISALLVGATAKAQYGSAGIEQGNELVREYFEPGTELMYGIGRVLALLGAIKVFQKWNAGDNDTGKVAAACSPAAFSSLQ